MKICNLSENSNIYTANAFLVTGTWNSLNDVNTLIDTGRDLNIIKKIEEASTGVGKRKIEQVIITHAHYDHTGILPEICKLYNPKVYAFSKFSDYVTGLVKDLQKVKIADKLFEVIHSPGHSNDSICLYCQEDGVLFAGDAPLIITSNDSSYESDFIEVIKRLSRLNIQKIYFGHGAPLETNCSQVLRDSFKILNKT